MQRGKTPKKVERNFPAAVLSVTHFSRPTRPPPARSAALFMTLSTSLAAVFLRHYTWKNSGPGKLDIESRVHAVRFWKGQVRARLMCPRRRAQNRESAARFRERGERDIRTHTEVRFTLLCEPIVFTVRFTVIIMKGG